MSLLIIDQCLNYLAFNQDKNLEEFVLEGDTYPLSIFDFELADKASYALPFNKITPPSRHSMKFFMSL